MKFFIKTLGCKVNQIESAKIYEDLIRLGNLPSSETNAELFVLNTCVVTKNAQKECHKIIKRWIKRNPKLIIITGCYPQSVKEELKAFLESLEFKKFLVLGQTEKLNLLENFILPEDAPIWKLKELEREETFFKVCDFPGHSRAFVKIQDGCDNFCAYCIVPIARGAPRSLDKKEVISQVLSFVERGYCEVVLTGINLSKWGKDLSPPLSISHLLFDLEEVLYKKGINTIIRLSSLEPDQLDEHFFEFVKHSKLLAPHFHIPLQSGSNRILKLMRRRYTREEYLEVVQRLYELKPYATLGADVIVGFPGEGEEEFRETYDLVKRSPLNWLHVFSYSPRPRTLALHLKDASSSKEVKQRVNELKSLVSRKRKDFLKTLLNKEFRGIVEKIKPQIRCLTENYVTLFVEGKEKLYSRDLVLVKPVYFKEDKVFAELVKVLKKTRL